MSRTVDLTELDEAVLRTRASVRERGLMKSLAIALGTVFSWRRGRDEAATVESWTKRTSGMLSGLHHRQWTLRHHLVAVRVLGDDPARVAQFASEKLAA